MKTYKDTLELRRLLDHLTDQNIALEAQKRENEKMLDDYRGRLVKLDWVLIDSSTISAEYCGKVCRITEKVKYGHDPYYKAWLGPMHLGNYQYISDAEKVFMRHVERDGC